MILVSASQMQEMDRRTIEDVGIPGRVLMEIAGREAASVLRRRYPQALTRGVAVFTGRGNNGGDGMVMARWLAESAIPVAVFTLSALDRFTGDAAANAALVAALGIPIIPLIDDAAVDAHREEWRTYGVIVDALLGTGLNAPVSGRYADVINGLNASGRPILSVDIPSGLNADTGQPMGPCVEASHTVAFAFAKIGHRVYPGSQHTGTLTVVDIGIPASIAAAVGPTHRAITRSDAQHWLPRRPTDAHKGTTGHVLVVGGTPGKIGAPAMTATAALRSGAGLVTLGVPAPLLAQAAAFGPELMTEPLAADTESNLSGNAADRILDRMSGLQCLAIGPGMGMGPEITSLMERLIMECPAPMVIDADGLNALTDLLDRLPHRRGRTVLTPHPGEMARLLNTDTRTVQADRLNAARQLASRTDAHVVLKGVNTIVAHPNGQVWINTSGNPGMAAGGMGDVLTGIIAGWVAQGIPIDTAARLGVYQHGAAADQLAESVGPSGYLATEVADTLPEILAEWQRGTP